MRRVARGWTLLICAIALVAVFFASRPAAASPTARLTLARGEGAEKCPDEDFVRKVVAARLGYDPFFAWARKTVIIEMARTAGGFRGRAQIVDDKGVVLGERVLEAKGNDCTEPMTALGLAISIALDDLEATEAVPPSTTASVPAPSPPPPPALPTAETPPDVPPRSVRPPTSVAQVLVAVGSIGMIGVAPAPTLGGNVSLGVSGAHWAVRADVFVDGRASATERTEISAAAQPWGTTLLGCGRLLVPYLCAVATLIAFESEAQGTLVFPHTGRAPLVGLGARAGVEFPPVGWYFVRGEVGADIHVLRPRLSLDGGDLYETSLASASLALSLGLRLF